MLDRGDLIGLWYLMAFGGGGVDIDFSLQVSLMTNVVLVTNTLGRGKTNRAIDLLLKIN